MLSLVIVAVASSSMDGVRLFTALPEGSCANLADALASASQKQNGTLWLAADAKPRTPMERAVAAVFALHTAGRPFDASLSGAEYWVQTHIEASDDGLSSGIHLHRDFDLGALASSGRSDVFPNVSTITYLTTARAMPTLILSDLDQGATIGHSVAHALWAIYPAAGKHVSFPGWLWHGVAPPAVFAPGVAASRPIGSPGRRRVTLLINIWLGPRTDATQRLVDDPPRASAYDALDVPALQLTGMRATMRARKWSIGGMSSNACGQNRRRSIRVPRRAL